MLPLRRSALLVVPIALGAIFLATYLLNSREPTQQTENKKPAGFQRPLDRPPGFQERANEAGLHFFMHFLSGEQGENYKINLYDHGAGIAVGDFDGDGLDDIYFVNQLGTNALCRNNGDGTFTDVTQSAGVGLGDRICVAATFADYDNSG